MWDVLVKHFVVKSSGNMDEGGVKKTSKRLIRNLRYIRAWLQVQNLNAPKVAGSSSGIKCLMTAVMRVTVKKSHFPKCNALGLHDA